MLLKKSLVEYHIVGERRNVELTTSACIYLACRIENVPRTILELSLMSGMNKSELGNLSFEVARRLDLQLRPILPEQYVHRICAEILLPIEYHDVAVNICRNLSNTGVLHSMAANTIAATVVLMISLGCRSTQRLHLLEEISFSSESKIRKCYAVLYLFISMILPPELPASFVFDRLPNIVDKDVIISTGKRLLLTRQYLRMNNFSLRTRETIGEVELDRQLTYKNHKRKQPCVWELSSLYCVPVMKNVCPLRCTGKSNVNDDFKNIIHPDNDFGTFSTEYINSGWSSLKKQR